MDAIKFIKERNRMCKSFNYGCGCQRCPACDDDLCCAISVMSKLDAKEQAAIVEKWSVEHPRKTRQRAFLEQYPDAQLTEDGIILICPMCISAAYRNKTGGCASQTRPQCAVCRREFWTQEVK